MEEDEFTFIEEQVKHKKSNKVISVIKKLGITVIMAAVFGAISALSFYFIYGSLTKKENKAPMPSYAVNDAEEDLKDRVTQPPQVKEPDAKDGGDRLAAFARKYSNVASFCEAQKDMLVVVSEIEDGIDYFETPVESVTSSIGLILSKNNQSIYVLTEGSSMGEGTSYEITMKDGTKLGAVYHAADTATGLMVLSADISGISAENRKSIKTAKIGTSSDIRKGNMVFAIGAPQSDMYSISYGYVCSDATKKYLPDRSVSVFNTNMNFTANASGYIVNSEEEVIGIISDSFFETEVGRTGCFLGITSLQGLINQLVSGKDRAAAGIILQDIAEEYLTSHGLKNGVYVQDINYGAKVLQAGLAVGDIIISLNGHDIGSVEEYTSILESFNAGDEISIEVYREYAPDDKYKTITVKLGKD